MPSALYLPKPLYETLPLFYLVAGSSVAILSEFALGVVSGLALAVAGVNVVSMRLGFRKRLENHRSEINARLRRRSQLPVSPAQPVDPSSSRCRPDMRRLVDSTAERVRVGDLPADLAARTLLESNVPVAVIGRVLETAVANRVATSQTPGRGIVGNRPADRLLTVV